MIEVELDRCLPVFSGHVVSTALGLIKHGIISISERESRYDGYRYLICVSGESFPDMKEFRSVIERIADAYEEHTSVDCDFQPNHN